MSDASHDPGSGGPRPADTPSAPQADAMLRRAIEVIEAARPMPLSTSSIINKEEVLELLVEASERMPDELRAARWLLKEREEFLGKVQREGDEILDAARARAERMVERTEINKAAEQRARRIVEHAQGEARRMRHEVEDFCDQKLASAEAVLQRTSALVASGRAKLQGPPVGAPSSEPEPVEDERSPLFFDQDTA